MKPLRPPRPRCDITVGRAEPAKPNGSITLGITFVQPDRPVPSVNLPKDCSRFLLQPLHAQPDNGTVGGLFHGEAPA
jgi:hypothetical protein